MENKGLSDFSFVENENEVLVWDQGQILNLEHHPEVQPCLSTRLCLR